MSYSYCTCAPPIARVQVNNAVLQAEGPNRRGIFFNFFLQAVIFDAPLNPATVLATAEVETFYPESVFVQGTSAGVWVWVCA